MDHHTLWPTRSRRSLRLVQMSWSEKLILMLRNQLSKSFQDWVLYVNDCLRHLLLESFTEDLVLKKETKDQWQIVKKWRFLFMPKWPEPPFKWSGPNHHQTENGLSLLRSKYCLWIARKYTWNGRRIRLFSGGYALYQRQRVWVFRIRRSVAFERGFSGYNGRLTQQSSGLGLYLSKNGDYAPGNNQISIASRVGHGTNQSRLASQVEDDIWIGNSYKFVRLAKGNLKWLGLCILNFLCKDRCIKQRQGERKMKTRVIKCLTSFLYGL